MSSDDHLDGIPMIFRTWVSKSVEGISHLPEEARMDPSPRFFKSDKRRRIGEMAQGQ